MGSVRDRERRARYSHTDSSARIAQPCELLSRQRPPMRPPTAQRPLAIVCSQTSVRSELGSQRHRCEANSSDAPRAANCVFASRKHVKRTRLIIRHPRGRDCYCFTARASTQTSIAPPWAVASLPWSSFMWNCLIRSSSASLPQDACTSKWCVAQADARTSDIAQAGECIAQVNACTVIDVKHPISNDHKQRKSKNTSTVQSL